MIDTKLKLELLESELPTKEYTNNQYTSDAEIEALFAPLIRELNNIIRFTDEYRYGNFRFRIIVDCDQVPTIMVADIKWDKNFGRDIRRICKHFNIYADFQDWDGFYYFYPLDQDFVDKEYDGSAWIRRIPFAIDNHKYGQR